ncbi:MAG TPA: 3-methyl-2-oxobutanoate hydroxymethyltransferase [Candidatus Synoicihabitans sp.]|nr:3-methyl-2-oxobutanoate hydroxymethyltransferase [Candidatus Synoicihabitans sp.]
MKTTPHTLQKLKGQRPIVAVTAYDAITARFADEAGVDLILVGDSVGNTLLGLPNTVAVTLDMIVHHAGAVMRAEPQALIVADVPFAEAHYSFRRVLASCQRLMQGAGVDAVKIEGGQALAPTIAKLVEAGIPVWGHIGLQPQQVKRLGRYKKFGVTSQELDALVGDARALEAAGCFSIVLELMAPNAAAAVTSAVKIPTVGIGAGRDVDGQILVYTDLLGLTVGEVPSFARRFAEAGTAFREGFAAYAAAVRERRFPE